MVELEEGSKGESEEESREEPEREEGLDMPRTEHLEEDKEAIVVKEILKVGSEEQENIEEEKFDEKMEPAEIIESESSASQVAESESEPMSDI